MLQNYIMAWDRILATKNVLKILIFSNTVLPNC